MACICLLVVCLLKWILQFSGLLCIIYYLICYQVIDEVV